MNTNRKRGEFDVFMGCIQFPVDLAQSLLVTVGQRGGAVEVRPRVRLPMGDDLDGLGHQRGRFRKTLAFDPKCGFPEGVSAAVSIKIGQPSLSPLLQGRHHGEEGALGRAQMASSLLDRGHAAQQAGQRLLVAHGEDGINVIRFLV